MQQNLADLAETGRAMPLLSRLRINQTWVLGFIGAFLLEGGILSLVPALHLPFGQDEPILGVACGIFGALLMMRAARSLKRQHGV